MHKYNNFTIDGKLLSMQGGEGTFFVSRNLAKKPYGSWAFSLIECVAVWALKLPVPHTDVLKPTNRKAFLPNYGNPKKSAATPCHKLVSCCLILALNWFEICKCWSGGFGTTFFH